MLGIYGKSKQEAMYPAYYVDAAGQKLDGGRRYTLRFAPGLLSAGQLILVDHHVFATGEPAGSQSDQSLPAQLRDAAATQPRGGWRTKETPRIKKVDLGNVNNAIRHCEEPLRRSNPGAACCGPWIASLRSQ